VGDALSSDLASLRIDRGPRPAGSARGGSDPDRRGRRGVVVGVVAVAALAAGGVLAWPVLRASIYQTEVSVTEILLLSPAQASITFASTGYVVPQTISKVGAKVQGRIARMAVKEGDTVAAGDVLFELDGADLRSVIRTGESRVAVARARAQTARANLAEVRQQVRREKSLSDQGLAPLATLADLEARAASLEEAVHAADAETAAAQAEVEVARVNLADLTVTAPIPGTVITKPPEAGELVGPHTGGAVELADFRSLVVETDVAETRLRLVKPGAPCEIVLDAYPDQRYRGRSAEIGKKINRAKATATVKVRFVDPVEVALPDMSARVSFLTEELSPEAMKEPAKVVIPGAAVADRDGRKVTFVVADGKAVLTPIAIGGKVGDGFVLVQGPAPGTRVVSHAPATMNDGSPVKERSP
jgi:RND family efflux transporter MFP subunit